MIKVAIAGATGYTGYELVKLLSAHPEARIEALLSQSQSGKAYSSIYPALLGQVDCKLSAMSELTDIASDCDVLFLALPHGASSKIITSELLEQTKVIDLGADYRLKNPLTYHQWYKSAPPSNALLEQAVYGLPELHRAAIKKSQFVANPGCYATAAILALKPLVSNALLDSDVIIVDAKSGVSGAGKSLDLAVHFNECNESIKAYKVASHRHTPEIEQEIASGSSAPIVSFTANLVPMSRGILATTFSKLKKGIDARFLAEAYQKHYDNEPFVKLLDVESPETRWVKDSNNCHIAVNFDNRTNTAVVISAIDNLIKGAAGQAMQNMNLMCGLPETTGFTKTTVMACK